MPIMFVVYHTRALDRQGNGDILGDTLEDYLLVSLSDSSLSFFVRLQNAS